MALTQDAKDRLLAAGTRLQDLAADSLKDLLDDVRWFTTLVLASIGGLGAYRQLRDAHSLSLPIVIVVLILCLTLLIFLVTVLIANQMKGRFNGAVNRFIERTLDIANDGGISPNDGEKQVETLLIDLRHRHSDVIERPQTLQFVGIAAFIAAAIIGIIFVIFSEVFLAVFGGGA